MLSELGVADAPVLTPTEAAVLRELRLHRPQLPLDTLLFTDPNRDPDDVVTYTIAKQLQVEGFLRLTDVVVTLGDADMRSQRAQLAKGVFDRLALPDVRVARGQDYPMTSTQAREHSKFLAEETRCVRRRTPSTPMASVRCASVWRPRPTSSAWWSSPE